MYEELKKLAEAATPGPWGYDGSYVCPSRVEGGTTYVESWKSVADSHQPENTKFIAAANPSAMLALISENEKLRKDAKYWSEAHDRELEWSAQLIEEREVLRKALADVRESLGREYWDQYAGLDETRDILDAALGKDLAQ